MKRCFAVLLLLATGCVSTSTSYDGYQIDPDPLRKIKVGASKTDVHWAFAKDPDVKMIDVDGAEVWIYGAAKIKETWNQANDHTIIDVSFYTSVVRFLWDKVVVSSHGPPNDKRFEGPRVTAKIDFDNFVKSANSTVDKAKQLGSTDLFNYTSKEKQPAIPTITKAYDKFTDTNTIRMGLFELGEQRGLHFELIAKYGKNLFDTFVLFTSYYSDKPRYSRNSDLYLLIDEDRVQLPTIYDSKLESSIFIESILASISLDQLHAISNAKNVEGKLGSTVFTISPQKQREFKLFIDQAVLGPDAVIKQSSIGKDSSYQVINGMYIKLPQNWHIEEGYFGFSYYISSGPDSPDDKFSESIRISVTNAFNKSLDESLAEGANKFRESQKGLQEVGREKVKVGSVEAWKMDFKIENQGVHCRGFSYVLIYSGVRYSINFFIEPSQFDKYKDLFRAVVDSISFD